MTNYFTAIQLKQHLSKNSAVQSHFIQFNFYSCSKMEEVASETEKQLDQVVYW